MNEEELKKILNELEELLKMKNKMYGDENMLKIGEKGSLVRMEDKIMRLKNLLDLKEQGTNQEAEIEDNWKDIAGYGIIGLMLQRNKWA